jgi:hypothetical protein
MDAAMQCTMLTPGVSVHACRVRASLHMVLCFSPVGDVFRQRLRMFPSLVNCTTIDWFNNWPLEALRSVARSSCADLELGPTADGDAGEARMLEGVLAACVHIHQSVEAKSKRYYDELRRCAARSCQARMLSACHATKLTSSTHCMLLLSFCPVQVMHHSLDSTGTSLLLLLQIQLRDPHQLPGAVVHLLEAAR